MLLLRSIARPLACLGAAAVLFVFAACSCAADNDPEQTLAKEILKKSGIEGGLVVHVGCGGGELTAALRQTDAFLVHGLDPDPARVAAAREHVRKQGLYGPVSIDVLRGKRLPYAENLVKLVVVEDTGLVPAAEVIRVLAPGGAAHVKRADGWKTTVQAWPKEIDDWTHYLHDASGNAVAHDKRVGPPHRVQWIAGPRHARQHDHLASLSALVAAKGRLFSIVDEGPIGAITLPADWKLVARDAFSGVLLWKRPLGSWETHLRRFRSGPATLARRLVAAGDRVYATLDLTGPLLALDAATGKTVRTYEKTEGTDEILLDGGVLYLVIAKRESLDGASGEGVKGPWAAAEPEHKRLVALDAQTGKVLWTKDDADAASLLPSTLAVQGGRLCYQDPQHVMCLDARTGQEVWRHVRSTDPKRPGWSAPTLVIYQDVVLCADREIETKEPLPGAGRSSREFWTFYRGGPGKLVALSLEEGEPLWECTCAESFHAPIDVFVADGLVWTGQNHARWLGGELHWLKSQGEDWYKEEPTLGRDPKTGEIKRRLAAGDAFTPTHHHRCYRNKATDDFILLGRTGVEFIDLEEGDPLRHNWIRGTCQYGIVPSHGLLYVTPHACACYIQSKLNGFWALAPKVGSSSARAEGTDRLERGPAYTDIPAGDTSPADSWPTYRHDAARSGATSMQLAPHLTASWQSDLGGALTAPVIADGRLLVAQTDAFAVHCLDAVSGEKRWCHTAGGRVDSPPTVCGDRVLFGSGDGCVTCLRASDGELVWRFCAAPEDRRIVACGRLESVWPVVGAVLVRDGVVYCTAGRTSYLDGGITLCRLALGTGELLSQTPLYSRDPQTGAQPEETVEGLEMPGVLPDVLSSAGEHVFLRDRVFDLQGQPQEETVRHLYCPRGFLDDSWWHRTYWMYGTRFYSGAGGWPRAAREFPSGRILVVGDERIYGFGRRPEYYRWTTANEYHLFATDKDPKPAPRPKGKPTAKPRRGGQRWQSSWSQVVPMHVRAMVLAGDTLFAAGPPDVAEEGSPQVFALQNPIAEGQRAEALAAWRGERGARLWAVAAASGKKRAALDLEHPPVWDGMAAAERRLYVVTTAGKVRCFAAKPAGER